MTEKNQELLEGGILMDVLSDQSFFSEHIVGAENFCVYEIDFLEKVERSYPEKNQKIIVYGYSDATDEADRAKKLLMNAGYKNVHILPGGLNQWKEDGGEAVKGSVQHIENGTYDALIDQSAIGWTGRKIGSKHFGKIGISSGQIEYSESTPQNGNIVVDMTEMTCDDLDAQYAEMLISHLKSDDFFSSEEYPEAHLNMHEFLEKEGVASMPNYSIRGDLTIKDVTQPISFDAFIHQQDDTVVLNAHFNINRSEWNVRYGSSKFFAKLGMHIVNDVISFDLNIIFKK